MIMHRLAGVRGDGPLAALAAGLREALARRWGDVRLAYAPAFSPNLHASSAASGPREE